MAAARAGVRPDDAFGAVQVLIVQATERSAPAGQRVTCSFCHLRVDPPAVGCVAVNSNVRAFKHEEFHIWQCPKCRCLHCLEAVDLRRYYSGYPIPQTLTDPLRRGLANVLKQLTRRGFSRDSSLLDYGCGAGLFLEYLRECGYLGGQGYDPYSAIDAYHSRAPLKPEAFDTVVVQDVVEHVEDPRALFRELDGYLKPGGHVLVGTPCADGISLAKPRDFWLQLHPPYHLHIYTRAALVALGRELGWEAVDVYDRPYYDTKTLGLNARAVNRYQWFSDGTLDAMFEPVPLATLRRSWGFMFLAYFGYWLSRKAEMAILFRKSTRTESAA